LVLSRILGLTTALPGLGAVASWESWIEPLGEFRECTRFNPISCSWTPNRSPDRHSTEIPLHEHKALGHRVSGMEHAVPYPWQFWRLKSSESKLFVNQPLQPSFISLSPFEPPIYLICFQTLSSQYRCPFLRSCNMIKYFRNSVIRWIGFSCDPWGLHETLTVPECSFIIANTTSEYPRPMHVHPNTTRY
jgi:hypothetical protein